MHKEPHTAQTPSPQDASCAAGGVAVDLFGVRRRCPGVTLSVRVSLTDVTNDGWGCIVRVRISIQNDSTIGLCHYFLCVFCVNEGESHNCRFLMMNEDGIDICTTHLFFIIVD